MTETFPLTHVGFLKPERYRADTIGQLCRVAFESCRDGIVLEKCRVQALAGEFAQEFPFVHAVLEGLAAVDKNDRHFVVKLTAKLGVGIDINFAPGETAATRELRKALFDDFTEVTSSAGVHYDGAGLRHVC
jgi:hypothetical protein